MDNSGHHFHSPPINHLNCPFSGWGRIIKKYLTDDGYLIVYAGAHNDNIDSFFQTDTFQLHQNSLILFTFEAEIWSHMLCVY